ncbi:unnamed protein product [Ectocarpus sp. 12 AP-2014]
MPGNAAPQACQRSRRASEPLERERIGANSQLQVHDNEPDRGPSAESVCFEGCCPSPDVKPQEIGVADVQKASGVQEGHDVPRRKRHPRRRRRRRRRRRGGRSRRGRKAGRGGGRPKQEATGWQKT